MTYDRAEILPSVQRPGGYQLELQSIKTLFLHQKYRPCINNCKEILDALDSDRCKSNDLYHTFAHFYLGLSHDEMGRHMHNQSRFKIQVLNEAERHYQDALTSLSSFPRDQLLPLFHETTTDENVFSAGVEEAPLSPDGMATTSPNTYLQNASPFAHSATATSTCSTQPDCEDLESHDSFDEIMTPHRALRRDISRMSLLEQRLPREMSRFSLIEESGSPSNKTSEGLLRPIRPGSPPKQYRLPPKLPYAGHTPTRSKSTRSSRIPQSTRHRGEQTPTKGARTASPSLTPPTQEQQSPCKSVKSLKASCIPREDSLELSDSPKPATREEMKTYRLNEHVRAMKIQIETHIALAQRAKLQTSIAQAERAAARTTAFGSQLKNWTNRTGLRTPDNEKKAMPSTRSYWSFTPAGLKANDKQKRIEAGRARQWKRERFQPSRYMQLAEDCLAEL